MNINKTKVIKKIIYIYIKINDSVIKRVNKYIYLEDRIKVEAKKIKKRKSEGLPPDS